MDKFFHIMGRYTNNCRISSGFLFVFFFVVFFGGLGFFVVFIIKCFIFTSTFDIYIECVNMYDIKRNFIVFRTKMVLYYVCLKLSKREPTASLYNTSLFWNVHVKQFNFTNTQDRLLL